MKSRTVCGYSLPPHSSHSAWDIEGTKPHSSRSLHLGWPCSAPLPCLPPTPPTGLQGGMVQGPAHLLDSGGWGGSSGIVLPPFHETLKGLPLDLHWLCMGAGRSGVLLPTPLWETPSLPPLSFVEFNLRIKSSPGAFRAWSQLRQDRVFQCLEPKGKY